VNIEAILFDLDGTLIDSTRDLADSVRHIQKVYAHPLSTDEEVATFIGDGVGKLVERALPDYDQSQLAEPVEQLKDYYRLHCLANTTIYPGVVETLTKLRHKKMAIVTNKPARISRRILDGLKLSDYFSVIVGGDTLPEKKPHPAPLLHAAKQLNVAPERCLMIGDSAVDVAAARAAGMPAIGILSNIGDREQLKKSKPDFLIQKFSDVIDEIKKPMVLGEILE